MVQSKTKLSYVTGMKWSSRKWTCRYSWFNTLTMVLTTQSPQTNH